MKHLAIAAFFLLLLTGTLPSQIRIVSVERLPAPANLQWVQPRFGPTGTSVYFTSEDFNGIWRYSLTNRTTAQLTSEAGSGLAFDVSSNESQLTYRRTRSSLERPRRTQEIVVMDIEKRTKRISRTGSSLATPSFIGTELRVGRDFRSRMPAPVASAGKLSLCIDNTKILLTSASGSRMFDPIGGGSYIWPALSFAGDRFAAYELSTGTIVCDTSGRLLSTLGKRDAAVWTRSGRYLVYMKDIDDGARLLSSDLYAVAPDGSGMAQLTTTTSVHEMNPQCSPTSDLIVVNTDRGELYLLTYVEAGK